MSEQPIQNGTQLEEALNQLMVSNTNIIRLAEQRMKAFTKFPHCLPAFTQIISRANTSKGVRQMAAVLMRSRVEHHWNKLDSNVQTTIKNILLQVLIKEPE